MYVTDGLSGLKKDIKKALKSGDAAKIQSALAREQAKLDKNPTSGKAAKRADYVSQLQVKLAQVAPASTAAEPIPQITPAPVVSVPTDASAMPGVPATVPTIAPLPAAESTAALAPVSNFGPAPMSVMQPAAFGPAESDTAPVAAPETSNMPLILGAVAVGALFLLMGKKKTR